MSHLQSQALLLHCLKMKMTSMILWILWTALYKTSSLHHCILTTHLFSCHHLIPTPLFFPLPILCPLPADGAASSV